MRCVNSGSLYFSSTLMVLLGSAVLLAGDAQPITANRVAAVVLDSPGEPTGDSNLAQLRFLSADGTEVATIGGLRDNQSIGGSHRVALDRKRQRVYACDFSGRVIAADLQGQTEWSAQIPAHAATVDPQTGHLWCLTGDILGAGETVIADLAGKEVTRLPYHGFDIAFSPASDSFWIVGPQVVRLTRYGQVALRRPLPEVHREKQAPAIVNGRNWTAVSVAPLPPQDGSPPHAGGAWVAVRAHPNTPGSLNRLIRFNDAGEAKTLIELGDTDPIAVTVDPQGNAWVADRGKQVLQFNIDGEQMATLRHSAISLDCGRNSGSLWIATGEEVLFVDKSGRARARFRFPSPSAQSWLASF